jgi:hypothetical protein
LGGQHLAEYRGLQDQRSGAYFTALEARVNRTFAVWTAGLLFHAVAFGQTLRLSRAAGKPDSPAVEVILKASPGQEPQALQWDTVLPSARLNFVEEKATAGPAAAGAGKSLACSIRPESAGHRTLRCILAGGVGLIPSGVVAVIALQALPAAAGSARVQIDGAIAVMKGPKEVPIPPAELEMSGKSPTSSPAKDQ